MRFAKIILAGLIALGGLWTSDTQAAEKRCGELGLNCVCSEPLNTTTYVQVGPWLNPGDSTTKQCTAEDFADASFTGLAITEPDAHVAYGDNNAAALAGLPGGHQVQYFLREPPGNVAAWHVYHQQHLFSSRTQAASMVPGTVKSGARSEYIAVKRMAGRFYVYRSPDYDFNWENGGLCTNSKLGGSDDLILSHIQPPKLAAYNFVWGPWRPYGPDCCGRGPTNPGENGPSSVSAWKGKWWRIEVVTTNRLGGVGNGYRLQVFARNITDNQPEQRILDTNGTSAEAEVGYTWTPSPDLTPGETSATGYFNMVFTAGLYRAGLCRGWAGISHFMMAQWDTDTGQRIGPAYEIEGGGSLPSAPSAVQNLRIK